MKVQLLMTAIVGVAVISAMTSSSAYAMEVPFWYETDLLTGEKYYVDHFDNGKKSWVKASPQVIDVNLEVQGIGLVIQTHAAQDLADVPLAAKLTAQEIKDVKIQNEADRTYDLLASLYPGLYPVIEREYSIISVVSVPEPVVVPEPVSIPEVVVVPEVVVPIPEPIQIVPEVVVPIPEPIPIVPEVIVPIPEVPQADMQFVPSVDIPIQNETGAPSKQDMTSEDWDEFLQDIVPADRPLKSIEDFFGNE